MSAEALQQRVRGNVFDYEAVHASFDHHRAAGELDAAWCLAHALSFLGKATRAEEALHDELRPRELRLAKQRLPEDVLRRHVAHPEQDLLLTCVFGLVARAVAVWRAVPPSVTLRPHKRIDPRTDTALVSRMVAYVAGVLDVPPPDLYLRPEELGEAVVMDLQRDGRLHPSLVVYRGLLGDVGDARLVFALGRHLSDLYPPHFCRVAVDGSPEALEAVLEACLHGAGLPVPGDAAMYDLLAREILGRMEPAAREQLRTIARRMVETGRSTDAKRWAIAVELTAYRTGLLLCGDLRAAAQMIALEPSRAVGMTMGPRDRIKLLVEYACSEDYVAARRAIGMDVGR